jgi:hypothetical protein
MNLAPKLSGLLGSLVVFGLALLSVGCEEGFSIKHRNETNETLFSSANEDDRIEIKANDEVNIAYISRNDEAVFEVVITDERGCVVLVQAATATEWKRDRELVIQPTDVPPPEERTDCMERR